MNNDFSTALKRDEKPKEYNNISESLELSTDCSLEYKEGVLNIIWFCCDLIAGSVAQKLISEGQNVYICTIPKKDIDQKEDEESKKRRESCYDGILEKHDYKSVLKAMSKMSQEEKDKWICWFEFNDLAPISGKILAMGFSKGLIPTMEDLELEKDRDLAKEIVKEHYKDLKLGEVEEFSDVASAIDFLQDTDKIWVLKGNNENAITVVPTNDDPELSKNTLIDALEASQKFYEDGGFILEEKIVGMLEITPQCVWLDGKVVFTDIDIENKPFGSENQSVQMGAMQTLVVKTQLKDKINDIAFPDWIHQKAKEHKGLFIFDASILVKDGVYYFGEFCANRWGFDSWFAEIAMSGSATEFFTNLFNGKNPLKNDFGVAVRGVNMHKDDKERRVLSGVSMTIGDEENTFLYDCKIEDDKYVSVGTSWDLVVFTGQGDTLNKAVDKAYESLKSFAFDALYFRPQFDFMSLDYISSIPNRYNGLNHDLFEAKDMEDMKDWEHKKSMKELSDKVEKALNEDE